MPEVVPFDTLKYVKRLVAHDFTRQQAEGLCRERLALLRADISSKADIDKLMDGFVERLVDDGLTEQQAKGLYQLQVSLIEAHLAQKIEIDAIMVGERR